MRREAEGGGHHRGDLHGADPQAKLEALTGVDPEAVATFEDQVKNGEPMPITTPPNVVGAPRPGATSWTRPPEGYVHAESNLEFDVLRGEHESVKFEVESEKFTSLTCSEAPTHHFQGSDYCKGTEKCDETCRMIMPPKCNTTEASFGVCAPTVKTVCDAMDNSKTACTLRRQKVLQRHGVVQPPGRAELALHLLHPQGDGGRARGVPRGVRRVGVRAQQREPRLQGWHRDSRLQRHGVCPAPPEHGQHPEGVRDGVRRPRRLRLHQGAPHLSQEQRDLRQHQAAHRGDQG